MKLVLALVSGAEPGEGPVLRVSIYSEYKSRVVVVHTSIGFGAWISGGAIAFPFVWPVTVEISAIAASLVLLTILAPHAVALSGKNKTYPRLLTVSNCVRYDHGWR